MSFKDKITNRFNIIMIVVVIMIIILSVRLAVMTIAKGDYYRELADNKGIKNVYKAPIRGEIMDKNGKLLAGNKPSFTVQILKDEVNKLKTEEKNEVFLNLIRLLEEDGAPYIDDFPIELNTIKYKEETDYDEKYKNPLDNMIDIIIEENLLSEVLDLFYINNSYEEHYDFIVLNKAISALKEKGIDLPIVTEIVSNKLEISFNKDKDIGSFKKEYKLKENDTPIDSVSKIINEDRAIIKKIIDNSLTRKLVYELFLEKAIEDNLILAEYSITFEEEYLNLKRELRGKFPKVTKDSSAEEDFINIFYDVSIKNFLEKSFTRKINDKEDETIIPGELLLDYLNEENINIPIAIDESKDNIVSYKYIDSENKKEELPIGYLIENIRDTKAYRKFMNDDMIRPLAQSQILEDGINLKISISEGYEYVSINNLNRFYKENNISRDISIEEAFENLREKYKLDENLSKYEVRPVFLMYNQLIKQGYLAYQPIYISYGIKESTVAKIEEGMMDTRGINISIEPVRYYPHEESAAHILGYLGKISQPNEIKEYIEEKEYSPSSLIGKTGIEQSFEDRLKGKGGIKRIEVDSSGNSTHIIEEEKSVPGDNVYLSIDLDLQKTVERSLEKTLKELQIGGTYDSKWGDYRFGINRSKNRPYENATSGATVVIDVKTGKVLASASYPSYDPNLFSTGINSSDWQSLFPEDEDDLLAPRPLYNIASQTALSPGSTFKMITGLTALEKGLSPNKTIRDMGYVEIGDKKFNCLLWTTSGRTHGHENLYDALRDSCNYYFYSLAMGRNQRTGENIGVKVEIDDIMEISNKFGLNEKTGIEINIPAESSGTVPNPQRKVENTKAMLWRLLNKEIEKTFNPDFDYSEEYKEKAIEEIISWLDMEEPLAYSEVLKNLTKLNINPEAPITNINGKAEPLASAIKFTYINFSGWNIQDTLRVTIGQGQNAYTPLQMANYVAILANGGYKHKLTLIDSIKNYSNTESLYEYKQDVEKVELNNYQNIEEIKKGMLKVTKEGAYRSIFNNFPVQVGAKTGTAENDSINPVTKEKYDDFSWFVAFAPYDDPEIAIATVLFQGGSGGYAAPMTRDIIGDYMRLDEKE